MDGTVEKRHGGGGPLVVVALLELNEEHLSLLWRDLGFASSSWLTTITMADVETNVDEDGFLPRTQVVYCGPCGMPPEYCEYSPDLESHCLPWLKKHHPDIRQLLLEARAETEEKTDNDKPPKPDRPWTTEERLTAFYQKYVPEKIDGIPALLEKYAGKEDKLFEALTKKYGDEPLDPYYSDSDNDDDDDEDMEDEAPRKSSKKRRGAGAKQAAGPVRVVVQKKAQKKKRCLTIAKGLEPALAINQHKLKDASKAFSKRFAGSSSVKDGNVIVQGDHVFDLAEMIVDKFQVPDECVFIDMGDGEELPLRG